MRRGSILSPVVIIVKSYEPKVQVLIVEDDEAQRRLFSRYCNQFHLTTMTFSDGRVVLEYVERASRRPQVYVVDLNMPIMDGFTLLERLRAVDPDAVVLIVTALEEPAAVIRAMKLGAFDYVVKPPDREQFQMALAKAFEFQHLRAVERDLRVDVREKLGRQLMELTGGVHRRRADVPLERESIRNLSTLLSQGAGIGTMSMLIDFLVESVADGETADICNVDPVVTQMLFDNLPSVEGVLGGLDRVLEIVDRTPEVSLLHRDGIFELIESVQAPLRDAYAARDLRFSMATPGEEFTVRVDRRGLSLILEELLLNAHHYGLPESSVEAVAGATSGYAFIVVRNRVRPGEGVPADRAHLVTEPFFRLRVPPEGGVDPRAFNFGLGLMVVDYTVKKYGGLFSIHTEADGDSEIVNAEIFLPLVEDAA